jgi:hypothetical protein
LANGNPFHIPAAECDLYPIVYPCPTIFLPTNGEVDALTLSQLADVEFRDPEAEAGIYCFEIPNFAPPINPPVHHSCPGQPNDQAATRDN